MSPDGADLLTTGRLPDALTVANRLTRKQQLPICGHYLMGDWRRIVDRLVSHNAGDRKGEPHDQTQPHP